MKYISIILLFCSLLISANCFNKPAGNKATIEDNGTHITIDKSDYKIIYDYDTGKNITRISAGKMVVAGTSGNELTLTVRYETPGEFTKSPPEQVSLFLHSNGSRHKYEANREMAIIADEKPLTITKQVYWGRQDSACCGDFEEFEMFVAYQTFSQMLSGKTIIKLGETAFSLSKHQLEGLREMNDDLPFANQPPQN